MLRPVFPPGPAVTVDAWDESIAEDPRGIVTGRVVEEDRFRAFLLGWIPRLKRKPKDALRHFVRALPPALADGGVDALRAHLRAQPDALLRAFLEL